MDDSKIKFCLISWVDHSYSSVNTELSAAAVHQACSRWSNAFDRMINGTQPWTLDVHAFLVMY